MKSTLAILYFLSAVLLTVLCLPAEGARRWAEVTNYAAKFMTPERERITLAYAEAYDVSWAVTRAIYQHERGPAGYEFGMKVISWEITRLSPQTNWQLEETARMVRIASREFTKAHHHEWAVWKGSEAKFQERYATRFIRFYCKKFQQPSSGCDGWTETVTAYYHKFVGREPARTKSVRIYRP